MAKTHDIRLQPTRDQRRELDRAAKAAGLRHTGPWVLSVALAAARVGVKAQSVPVGLKPALAGLPGATLDMAAVRSGIEGLGSKTRDDVPTLPPRSKLTRSFDPDA